MDYNPLVSPAAVCVFSLSPIQPASTDGGESRERVLKTRHLILFLACCLCVSTRVFAIDLGGTVTNGTTGKPAAGVQLTLLSLSTGMQPIGNAVSDSRGHYSLTARDANGMLLLRASFEGANYHQRVTPGESTVDITVYNAADKVDSILGEGRILRVQASGGEMEVSEMFSLRNESRPPRTRTGDHSFEFSLPQRSH